MVNQAVRQLDVSQLKLELENIQKLRPAYQKQQETIEELRNYLEETLTKNRILQLLLHRKNNTINVYNRAFERIITERADMLEKLTAENVEKFLKANSKPSTDDEEEEEEKEEEEEASDGEVEEEEARDGEGEDDDAQEEEEDGEEVYHDSEDSFDNGESQFNSDGSLEICEGGIEDTVDDSEDGYCVPAMRDYH